MSNRKLNETRLRLHEAVSTQNYHLELFGDHIAEREGYKSVNGLEAVQYYLVHKHSWLPSQVKAMSLEDMRFALCEEMDSWTVPKDS